MDARMGNFTNTGRFMKQYKIRFPDGAELHAWIFLTNECHLVYGHTFKSPDGRNELYACAHEREFFEFPDLDETVTTYLKAIAKHSKALIRVIEFAPESSLPEQVEAMKKIGADTGHGDKINQRSAEIEWLDELWDRSNQEMPEEETNDELDD